MLVHLFVCFFFFKQKTAYEMRISDWSSDVCSSDLERLAQFRIHTRRELLQGLVEPRRETLCGRRRQRTRPVADLVGKYAGDAGDDYHVQQQAEEHRRPAMDRQQGFGFALRQADNVDRKSVVWGKRVVVRVVLGGCSSIKKTNT